MVKEKVVFINELPPDLNARMYLLLDNDNLVSCKDFKGGLNGLFAKLPPYVYAQEGSLFKVKFNVRPKDSTIYVQNGEQPEVEYTRLHKAGNVDIPKSKIMAYMTKKPTIDDFSLLGLNNNNKKIVTAHLTNDYLVQGIVMKRNQGFMVFKDAYIYKVHTFKIMSKRDAMPISLNGHKPIPMLVIKSTAKDSVFYNL